MRQLDTTGYYAFGVPLYAALVAGEYFLARRRQRATLSLPDSLGNLSAGLGAIVVGLYLGPLLVAIYDWGYAHLALVHFAPGSLWPWLLAVVLADFGHYLHHRLDHRVAACWAVHGVHHQPEELNFTVAMRHAWFSDPYSIPFYVLAPLCGVQAMQFFFATTLLSLHALATHSAEYNFPSLGIFVTPRSHSLHHARNPAYLDKNFGAMLCIWDRLFGTHIELDPADPPRYGTPQGYETHDGVLAQLVLWRQLFFLAAKSPTRRDRLRLFFARPGWRPPGVEPAPLVSPPPSGALALRTKLLATLIYAATTLFALYIFLWRDQHSWLRKGLGGVVIVGGLLLMGALLDGRLLLTRRRRFAVRPAGDSR